MQQSLSVKPHKVPPFIWNDSQNIEEEKEDEIRLKRDLLRQILLLLKTKVGLGIKKLHEP